MRRRTRTLLLQRKRGLPFPPNPPKVFLCAPPARACVHAHRARMRARARLQEPVTSLNPTPYTLNPKP